MDTVKRYYHLTKPGIIYGNLVAYVGGFALGSPAGWDWALFIEAGLALSFTIASACVLNNIYDKNIDAKMERTKNRPSVIGTISKNYAIIFAALLLTFAIKLFWVFVNKEALCAALVGFLVYVFVYTPLKHKTGHALWVGAIAGATPPVVGYAAATGILIDANSVALFVFLFLWQVPHFLGIATFRFEEYTAAGVPLLISKPNEKRKRAGKITFYISLLVLLLWCGALILQR